MPLKLINRLAVHRPRPHRPAYVRLHLPSRQQPRRLHPQPKLLALQNLPNLSVLQPASMLHDLSRQIRPERLLLRRRRGPVLQLLHLQNPQTLDNPARYWK